MNPISIALGAFALGYGLFTLVMRSKNPSGFGKLEAMKKMWGDRAGLVIHIIAYTIVPIAVGIVFLFAGFMGRSPFSP